jgi:hypothetical protein
MAVEAVIGEPVSSNWHSLFNGKIQGNRSVLVCENEHRHRFSVRKSTAKGPNFPKIENREFLSESREQLHPDQGIAARAIARS